MDFQTTLLILAVLGTILFLVALVMSYRSWRWHTLLLVWLIFAAGSAAIWVSVTTLKVHQSWREILLVNDRDPSAGQPNAVPIEISADNMVTVDFDRPPTYRLEKDLPIYVFSSEPDKKGDQYLGMFQVAEVTGNQAAEGEEPAANTGALQAVLRPQWPVTEAERNRLQKSVENGDLWILNAGLIEKTEALRKENYQLEFGVEDERGRITKPGISQLELQLAALLMDRGRMWVDAQPVDLSPEGVVTVEFKQPQTYRLEKKVPLYIFSGKSFLEGGQYLGMFLIEEVTGNPPVEGEEAVAPAALIRATLRPGWPISAEERKRLTASVQSEGAWTIYDKTPVDRHQIFSKLQASDLGIEEDQFDELDRETRLRKILPQASVQEFIDDYQTAQAEHSIERIEELVEFLEDYYPGDEDGTEPYFAKGQQVWLPRIGAVGNVDIRDPITGGTITVQAIPALSELLEGEEPIIERIEGEGSPRYSRKLRDYAYLFRDLYRERQRQQFEIDETVVKIREVEKVIDEKQQIIVRFEAEKTRLTSDQKNFLEEQGIIDKLTTAMRNQSTSINRRLVEVRNETIRLGKQLNAKQLKAVKEIDRRAPDPGATSDSG